MYLYHVFGPLFFGNFCPSFFVFCCPSLGNCCSSCLGIVVPLFCDCLSLFGELFSLFLEIFRPSFLGGHFVNLFLGIFIHLLCELLSLFFVNLCPSSRSGSTVPETRSGSGEGSGEGLGGFGAEPGQVGRLWCRARSGSIGFLRRFRRRSGTLSRRVKSVFQPCPA